MKEWYIGKKVWCKVRSSVGGVVTKINEEYDFPVYVEFEDGEEDCYTLEGQLHKGGERTLFGYPYNLKIEREEIEFIRNSIVLARNNEAQLWEAKRYLNPLKGGHLCAEADGISSTHYNFCVPFEGNEHLLLTSHAAE